MAINYNDIHKQLDLLKDQLKHLPEPQDNLDELYKNGNSVRIITELIKYLQVFMSEKDREYSRKKEHLLQQGEEHLQKELSQIKALTGIVEQPAEKIAVVKPARSVCDFFKWLNSAEPKSTRYESVEYLPGCFTKAIKITDPGEALGLIGKVVYCQGKLFSIIETPYSFVLLHMGVHKKVKEPIGVVDYNSVFADGDKRNRYFNSADEPENRNHLNYISYLPASKTDISSTCLPFGDANSFESDVLTSAGHFNNYCWQGHGYMKSVMGEMLLFSMEFTKAQKSKSPGIIVSKSQKK